VNIITNNHQRQMACLLDLPDNVRADFDYVAKDGDHTARFVRYLGCWYDVLDSQACGVGFDQFKRWDGIVSETFFSGVLFRFVGDDEVIVGRYFA
jgi:hypothetical protein